MLGIVHTNAKIAIILNLGRLRCQRCRDNPNREYVFAGQESSGCHLLFDIFNKSVEVRSRPKLVLLPIQIECNILRCGCLCARASCRSRSVCGEHYSRRGEDTSEANSRRSPNWSLATSSTSNVSRLLWSTVPTEVWSFRFQVDGYSWPSKIVSFLCTFSCWHFCQPHSILMFLVSDTFTHFLSIQPLLRFHKWQQRICRLMCSCRLMEILSLRRDSRPVKLTVRIN